MNTITIIAIVSISSGFLCCIIMVADLWKHPQRMGIMNIVWPVTALYSGPLGLWAYYSIGRKDSVQQSMPASSNGKMPGMTLPKPFWQSVVTGALHCGSGCTIGDLLSEAFLWFVPVTLAGSQLAGTWTVDYVFAFIIGIVFQYYAIKPMKQLSSRQAILAALKADSLSLSFWQIGMYGWMAICFFVIFHRVLKTSGPLFWFMMQIAMMVGFITALPVNAWLLKRGIKEAM